MKLEISMDIEKQFIKMAITMDRYVVQLMELQTLIHKYKKEVEK